MNEPVMQFTLREMKANAQSSRFWIGLFGVVCILTVTAPFDTGDQFNTLQRFVYWGAIAVSTYFLAIFFVLLVSQKLISSNRSVFFSRAFAAVVTGIIIGFWVFIVNVGVVGIDEFKWHIFFRLMGNCILISLAVCTIFFLVHDTFSQDQVLETPTLSRANTQFFTRLPIELGTDIISLQAQDHYVEVKTVKGSELILIRLADAIAELKDVMGVQTHRSWWVASKHIKKQKRNNGKAFLELSNGEEVPISRTYQTAVKQHVAS